ncbi:MAG: Uma2 family endonuclease [Deltaproteobacteria bacterium]|nr:Uma2 family endonuclease [Deltaproteobacteria bacterium]
MPTQPSDVPFTYQDYLNTPDDVRCELIEGELLVMEPAPATSHQRVLVNLTLLLAPFAREHGLGEVFIAPTDVYLSDTNVVQPDLLFVSAARASIVTERDVHGAPDLVVEIASPSTRQRDRGIKMEIYARYGVVEYWLVDPATATVETLPLKDGQMVFTGGYGRPDTFTTPLLPGLEVDLGLIF